MCIIQYVFSPKSCIIAQNTFTLHREIKKEHSLINFLEGERKIVNRKLLNCK